MEVSLSTKMTSAHVHAKLRQILSNTSKDEYHDAVKWMANLREWIEKQFPELQIQIVKGTSIAWLVIHPSIANVEQIGTHVVRLLVNMDKCNELHILQKVTHIGEKDSLTDMSMLSPYLSSFVQGSDYIICKGNANNTCELCIKGKATHTD